MSTSPVLVALYLGFDPLKLSPSAQPIAAELLQRIAAAAGTDAMHAQSATYSLVLGAHTEPVIDALLGCYSALMQPQVRTALRGALTPATLSVTANGRTITRRSIESVQEMAKVVELGGIFISDRLLSIINFYSPRHAACFSSGRRLETSIGPLIEFMPPAAMLAQEAGATVSGFTVLMPPPGKLRDQLIQRAEQSLSRRIGPLAALLVKRSNALAQNWNEFVFMVTADLQPELRPQIKSDLGRIWDECNGASEDA